MNKPVTHLFDPRHAGNIRRYHTHPHIHEQNVDAHCINALRITLGICPEIPRHVLVHIVVHDVGEIGGGDLPMYAKRDNPILKRQLDKIENNTHLGMCFRWYLPHPQELTDFEKAVFKLAEALEIFEWSWYEYNLGNNYAKPAIEIHRQLVFQKIDELKAIEKADVPAYANITEIVLRASRYYERREKTEQQISEMGVA